MMQEPPGAQRPPGPEVPGAGPPAPPPAGGPPEPAYPVRLDARRQAEYNRFLPLVKWLLAIPHWIILFFLYIGAFFAWIASWWAVLITGRYPRGIFDFLVGVHRWTSNVTAYTLLMVDPYPPFSLEQKPDYPVRFDIEYPEPGIARWRPLLHWLLVIPYSLVAAVLVWLAYIVEIAAFFALLFTKRFPKGIFDFVLIALRWQMRASAYANWMIARYPPFVWA